jgi:hypothetical protein
MAILVDTTINGSLTVKGASDDITNGFKFHNETDKAQWAITPLTKSTLDLGSPTKPFRNVYADSFQLTIPPQDSTTEGGSGNGNATTNETTMQFSDDPEKRISSVILGNNLPQSKQEGDTEVQDPSSRQGRILLFGANQAGTYLQTAQKGTTDGTFNTITLPAKDGTVSLEGHSHAFKTTDFKCICANSSGAFSKKTTEKYHTSTGQLYGVKKNAQGQYVVNTKAHYGTVTVKNCYGWGSDFLDVFVIRGYAEFKVTKKKIPANARLRICCMHTPKKNYLPGVLMPLSIYRYSTTSTDGMLTSAKEIKISDSETDYESYIDIRCAKAMPVSQNTTYTLYFTATYGKVGASIEPEVANDDNATPDAGTTEDGDNVTN